MRFCTPVLLTGTGFGFETQLATEETLGVGGVGERGLTFVMLFPEQWIQHK